jgi:hypothetical protein
MPKRKHTKRYIAIITALAILVTLVIFSSLSQKSKPKPPANEYLKVQHTRSIATTYTEDNKTIIIKTLGINITAIGGDDHYVIIDVGSQDPKIITEILNGTTLDYPIDQVSIPTELDTDKGVYLISIEIQCQEAEHASLLIEARPQDIIITRQQIRP